MATKLKAKDPKSTEPSKPKIVIYGPSGVGKTWWALSFPAVYYIDTEGGATRTHYMERLSKSGGVYLGPEDGSNDFETIIDQVKALATEKHKFKTLVIDSITKTFISCITAEGERLGIKNAFGADKKPAVQSMRRLVNAIERLDMNVIFIAHEKSEWGLDAQGNRAELGKIPDTHEKLIYELDLGLQIQKRGPDRKATVKKSRLLGFPEGESFILDFETFAERYGKDVIEKASVQIVLASVVQVEEINRLVELLKVEQETVDKWLEKAKAEKFEEFNADQAAAIIKSLTEKLTKTTTK
jgi:AAA domain